VIETLQVANDYDAIGNTHGKLALIYHREIKKAENITNKHYQQKND